MAQNKPKSEIPSSKKNENLKFYILLAVIAFAVYANSLSSDFVFDDESVVLGDPSLTTLSNLPKYFTGEEGFHKVIGRYYRPVVSSSYAIDYSINGTKPLGYHITNVLINIINTLLVFRLLMLLFLNVQHKYKSYFLLIGAGLFAIHPIHTEAVAWISGRTDSLFFTFFAAAFIYYLKYRDEKTTLNLSLCSLFYFLSLLSKEMAITLPAVIILHEVIVNRKRNIKDFAEDWFFYISALTVSLLFLLMRWLVLKDVPDRQTYYYFFGKDAATIFFTMLQTVPLYFRLDFLPYGMLYHYSGYLPYFNSLLHPEVIFAVVFIGLMLWSAYYLRDRLSWVSFTIMFVFITLLPVLNIIPTMNFMADRFLYLPSLALSFAAVGLLIKYYTPKRQAAIYSVIGVLAIFFVYLTITRNADWKTNDALFMSADGRPGTITCTNIGNIYANKQDYDKAETYFRKAIDLRSETILANNNLGKIFMIKGNFDSAYYYMYKAYSLDTLSPEPMHSIAVLMSNNRRIDDAIFWLNKVHKVGPGYMNSHQMLDQLMSMKGADTTQQRPIQPPSENVAKLEKESYDSYLKKDYKKSIEQLNALMKINPGNAASYFNNIGMCYLDMTKYDDAVKSFESAIRLTPNFPTAYNNIGSAYQKQGKMDKAREMYKKALELDPNNQDAIKKLAELSN